MLIILNSNSLRYSGLLLVSQVSQLDIGLNLNWKAFVSLTWHSSQLPLGRFFISQVSQFSPGLIFNLAKLSTFFWFALLTFPALVCFLTWHSSQLPLGLFYLTNVSAFSWSDLNLARLSTFFWFCSYHCNSNPIINWLITIPSSSKKPSV